MVECGDKIRGGVVFFAPVEIVNMGWGYFELLWEGMRG